MTYLLCDKTPHHSEVAANSLEMNKGLLLTALVLLLCLDNAQLAAALCLSSVNLELRNFKCTMPTQFSCPPQRGSENRDFKTICGPENSPIQCNVATVENFPYSTSFGLHYGKDNRTVCFGPHRPIGEISYLDGEIIGKYVVTCLGSIPDSTASKVNVTVRFSSANNYPKFQPRSYSFVVKTRAPPFGVPSPTPHQVKADDQDAGVKGLLSYSVKGTTDFKIGLNSGILYDNRNPDNSKNKFVFSVTAHDQGQPSRTSTATVTVTVNVTPPRCEQTTVNVQVTEQSLLNVPTSFYKVKCEGVSSYEIKSVDQSAREFFKIEPKDGSIQVIKRLRANVGKYEIQLKVYGEEKKYTTVTVHLTVKDMKPVCEDKFTVNIFSLTTKCVHLVPSCTSPYKDVVSYNWTQSTGLSQFTVDDSRFGALKICTRSPKASAGLKFLIDASIPKMSSAVKQINVVVNVIQKVSPVKFTSREDKLSGDVVDSTAVGKTVLQTKEIEGEFTPKLLMEPDCRYFSVEKKEKTAVLNVSRPIVDLPMNKIKCDGILLASSEQQKTSVWKDITIQITDINTPPTCPGPISASVPYSASKRDMPTKVTDIACTDNDFTTKNTDITYSLQERLGYQYFKVEGNSLFLKASQDLPRDKPRYIVVCNAQNAKSTKPLTTSVTVTVSVTGMLPPDSDLDVALSMELPCKKLSFPGSQVDYAIVKETLDLHVFSRIKISFLLKEGINLCVLQTPRRNLTTGVQFKAILGDQSSVFTVSIKYTSYTVPTFSQDRYLGFVYIETAKVGDVIVRVNAVSRNGRKVTYRCKNCEVSDGGVYLAIDRVTGIVMLKRRSEVPRKFSLLVEASDTSGQRSFVYVDIRFLRSCIPPQCRAFLEGPPKQRLDHFTTPAPLGFLTCPSLPTEGKMIELHGEVMYLAELKQIKGGQFRSFNCGKLVSTQWLHSGVRSDATMYLLPDFPKKRAEYITLITVSCPRGAGSPAKAATWEYNMTYSLSVAVPEPSLQWNVGADFINVNWDWRQAGNELETMYREQVKNFQVKWEEIPTGSTGSRNTTNAASALRLHPLKADTTYQVLLIVYHVDPYYQPLEGKKDRIKTARPHSYEVLLRLSQGQIFHTDLLVKKSERYKKTLRAFEAEFNERFKSKLTGFLSSTFKYFARGSVVAAANVVLNLNVAVSNATIYRTAGGNEMVKLTEQGKGSVKIVSMITTSHTEGPDDPSRPARSVVRNPKVHIKLEGRPSAINCAAEAFGPETPVFKWYLRGASVLNITTVRVYFSNRQNSYGHYVSSLRIKKMVPTDSGNITCHVELKPLSSKSETKFDQSTLKVAVLPKPVMVIRPLRAAAREGGSVTIECFPTYPTVENIYRERFQRVKWKRNGVLLNEGTAAEVIKHETDASRITITNLQEDTNYTCVGTNTAGTGEATSMVSVTSADAEQCEAEKDSYGISWTATYVGRINIQPCMKGYTGNAYRRCVRTQNGHRWDRPNLVHCFSDKIKDIYDESVDLAEGINRTTVESTSAQLKRATDQGNLVSGDLELVNQIIGNLVVAENIRQSGTKTTEENIIESASNVLELSYKQGWMDVQKVFAGTPLLMKNVDWYGQIISGRHRAEDWRVVPSKNIVLQTKKTSVGKLSNDVSQSQVILPDYKLSGMPNWVNSMNQIKVDVKSIQDQYGDKSEVGVSGLQYKTLNEIIPANTSTDANRSVVNSNILTLSIVPTKPSAIFKPPIRITFQHAKEHFTDPVCSFWDFEANDRGEKLNNAGAWSTSGCEKVAAESDRDSTTCECNHLTNFAILMSPATPTKPPHPALKWISWIGCGVSIFCLLLTIIIYAVYWKKVKSDRSVILMNLCVSLTLALVIFLAGVERKENKHVCTAIAALLHFFFFAVFSFMLMEGVELYILLVKVFDVSSSRKKWYIMGGWGLPAILVAISLGATQAKGYGNDHFCWLSLENGLLWAFVGPALAVILINCVFLGLAMKSMFSSKIVEEKKTVDKIKQGIRGLCILMPLLGTTWVMGVLAVNDDLVVFQYIFTVCNSLQGLFIFIFHCLMNKQLLKTWKEKRTSKTSSRRSSSATAKQMTSKDQLPKNRNRKGSSPTVETDFGLNYSTSGFTPEPSLGVMTNRAFDDSDQDDIPIYNPTEPITTNIAIHGNQSAPPYSKSSATNDNMQTMPSNVHIYDYPPAGEPVRVDQIEFSLSASNGSATNDMQTVPSNVGLPIYDNSPAGERVRVEHH